MLDELLGSESHNSDKPMSIIAYVIYTGLFAGIFWSAIGYLSYLFNFTVIRPNFILEPWALGNWKHEWLGTVISIFMIGVFSVIAAFIYYLVLKNLKSRWGGIFYGIALFLLVFLVLNPIFPGIKPFREIDRNTMITSACLFIVYGIFVGYSISYEYQSRQHIPKGQKDNSQ